MIRKISTYNPLSSYNKAIKQLINNGIRPTKQRMILAKLLFEKGQKIYCETLVKKIKVFQNNDKKVRKDFFAGRQSCFS